MRLEPGRLVRRHGEGDRVRLAEAVAPERLDDLPGAGDHLGTVLPPRRLLCEPDPDPGLRLGVGEPAPHPVGLASSAAGHDVHHLDDLLVEDDHPVGVAQRSFQVGVGIAHGRAAVPGLDERPHHVGGDRTRPEQRDVDHQVVEGGGLEPADQVALARRLDLEAAERLGAPDEPVRLRVALRHGVQVDLPPRGPLHLGHRVRHRRLHPHAEHVELEQPEVLHVVLVELGHRETLAAGGHDRGAPQQRVVREEHPARVHGDAARQGVQRLHQVPEPAVLLLLSCHGAQFGEFLHRGAGVPGPDVREGLGEPVGLGRVHGERGADVADGVAHPVGLGHGDGRDPLGAEAADDRAVDVETAGGLDVDVDVGQHEAPLGQEALHEQPVFDRVGVGDPEQVVDQGAGPGAARGDAYAHPLHIVDDLGDRQEVGGEAVVGDDVQLTVHPLPVVAPAVVAVPHHARGGAGGQHPLGGAPPGPDEVRLGEVDTAEAQVVRRVDAAGVGGAPGLREQQPPRVPPEPRRGGDPPGGLLHRTGVLEPALPGVEGGTARVDGDEPAGRVEYVGDGPLPRVGVPDGVGQHGPHPLLGGEADGTGGEPERPGAGALAAVVDGFEAQGVAVDLAPGGEQHGGPVGPARGECGAHLGGGAEQHGEPFRGQRGPGEQGLSGARGVRSPRVRGVGGGDQPAQFGPAMGAVPGEEGDPGCGFIDKGTPADRRARPVRTPLARHLSRSLPCHRELRPEERPYPGLLAGPGEADRAREAVAVGQREGVHPPLDGTLGQPLRVRCPVPQGEPGKGMQMREP